MVSRHEKPSPEIKGCSRIFRECVTTSNEILDQAGGRFFPSKRSDRIAFFDLDNTLIPTSWIMQKWRVDEHRLPHSRIVTAINDALVEAGLFHAIDRLLTETRRRVDKIIIVTNAGSRTVQNFYLVHTLPQLKELLIRHDVQLTSTEEWVLSLGPPPSPDHEDAFREFYTNVKVLHILKCLR